MKDNLIGIGIIVGAIQVIVIAIFILVKIIDFIGDVLNCMRC